MLFIARLVHIVMAVYGIGLICYIVLTWLNRPDLTRLQRSLKPLYEPILSRLRHDIPSVTLGQTKSLGTKLIAESPKSITDDRRGES
jgi:uncharacterized protein YggT (Ycf19 family)